MMTGGTVAAPYGARNGSGAPIRLKAIVLGSAGAGKTSILRRYFNNVSSPVPRMVCRTKIRIHVRLCLLAYSLSLFLFHLIITRLTHASISVP